MRYIEQGIDKYGVTCWFVLNDAELIGEYYTLSGSEYLFKFLSEQVFL